MSSFAAHSQRPAVATMEGGGRASRVGRHCAIDGMIERSPRCCIRAAARVARSDGGRRGRCLLTRSQAATTSTSTSVSLESSLADVDAPSARVLADGGRLHIRMASRADEMTQTAILRAEAYYEERAGWGRFVENYKRMYAQRERERLVRMAKGSCIDGVATPALPLCLVCVDGESGAVVGSIDVMALGACNEVWDVRALGPRDPDHRYLKNVCVRSTWRRRGVGRLLIGAGITASGEVFRERPTYVHALEHNDTALKFYDTLGFVSQGPPLRGLVLLRRDPDPC